MNNLIFGECPHKKFSNTFLTKVLVELGFDPLNNFEGLDVSMDKYSLDIFGIPGPKNFPSNAVRLSTTDGMYAFQFSKEHTSVEISGKVYESFYDTIIPQVFKLKSFVKDVINKDVITTISIRKLNIWQFENSKEAKDSDVDSLRNYVFSKDFNQLPTNVTLTEEEQNIAYFKKYRWQEDNGTLELCTTFQELIGSSSEKHMYGLILDSKRIERVDSGIPCKDIESILKNINMDLYNAYMWSVSESIKRIMETGKE